MSELNSIESKRRAVIDELGLLAEKEREAKKNFDEAMLNASFNDLDHEMLGSLYNELFKAEQKYKKAIDKYYAPTPLGFFKRNFLSWNGIYDFFACWAVMGVIQLVALHYSFNVDQFNIGYIAGIIAYVAGTFTLSLLRDGW